MTETGILKSARTPLRKGTRLREVAYQAIKDAILQGTLNTDQPLIEERIAEQLHISRTPVREALAILEHEGLLESVPYQGLFIKDITVATFLEMYETVELIEPELARRATLNATPQAISAMEASLRQAHKCIPADVPGHLFACRQFFHHLGTCAQQQHLSSLLMTIEEHSDLYLITKQRTLPPDKMLAAITDREAILNAIRSGDAEQAALKSQQHAQAVRQRWQDMYLPE